MFHVHYRVQQLTLLHKRAQTEHNDEKNSRAKNSCFRIFVLHERDEVLVV